MLTGRSAVLFLACVGLAAAERVDTQAVHRVVSEHNQEAPRHHEEFASAENGEVDDSDYEKDIAAPKKAGAHEADKSSRSAENGEVDDSDDGRDSATDEEAGSSGRMSSSSSSSSSGRNEEGDTVTEDAGETGKLPTATETEHVKVHSAEENEESTKKGDESTSGVSAGSSGSTGSHSDNGKKTGGRVIKGRPTKRRGADAPKRTNTVDAARAKLTQVAAENGVKLAELSDTTIAKTANVLCRSEAQQSRCALLHLKGSECKDRCCMDICKRFAKKKASCIKNCVKKLAEFGDKKKSDIRWKARWGMSNGTRSSWLQ